MSPGYERCVTRSVQADPLEDVVWSAVTDALKRPEALVEEYRKRLEKASSQDGLEAEQKQVNVALRRVQAQEDRITDAYINEVMDLDRYMGEMVRLQERRAHLQRTLRDVELGAQQSADGVAALDHLEAFCRKVTEGLDALDFEERQQLLRLLVERVTLMPWQVCIETVIPVGPGHDKLRTRRGEPVEPRTACATSFDMLPDKIGLWRQDERESSIHFVGCPAVGLRLWPNQSRRIWAGGPPARHRTVNDAA